VAYVLVPKPTVLVEHGRFVPEALNEERISPRDVFDAMQKAGIITLAQVQWAVLQSDGSIAVIPAYGGSAGQSEGIMHGAHRGG
jgi:uncharacterized membrane protein YcaP (DUF421 family)